MKGILRKHSNAYYFYFSMFMEMNLICPNTVRILYKTSKVDTIFLTLTSVSALTENGSGFLSIRKTWVGHDFVLSGNESGSRQRITG